MENEHLSPEDELRAENEIKALDLELQFGAKTFISDDAPPELIQAFLKNVQQTEADFQNVPMISIYEFIGSPKFAPIDLLETDEQFEQEIERILELLFSKRMLIDRPEFLKPAGYYRFLVNDIFPHQMRNYTGETIMHNFAYHEFHQDGPEFIGFHAQAVIEDILDLRKDFTGEWITETCRSGQEMIPKAKIVEKVLALFLLAKVRS